MRARVPVAVVGEGAAAIAAYLAAHDHADPRIAGALDRDLDAVRETLEGYQVVNDR